MDFTDVSCIWQYYRMWALGNGYFYHPLSFLCILHTTQNIAFLHSSNVCFCVQSSYLVVFTVNKNTKCEYTSIPFILRNNRSLSFFYPKAKYSGGGEREVNEEVQEVKSNKNKTRIESKDRRETTIQRKMGVEE